METADWTQFKTRERDDEYASGAIETGLTFGTEMGWISRVYASFRFSRCRSNSARDRFPSGSVRIKIVASVASTNFPQNHLFLHIGEKKVFSRASQSTFLELLQIQEEFLCLGHSPDSPVDSAFRLVPGSPPLGGGSVVVG